MSGIPPRVVCSSPDVPSSAVAPLVTVVVPTKNAARDLERCLQSIRAQTYPHVEVIVVDNSSTDETQDIARRYADRVMVSGPERSAQVNAGVAAASGTLIYKVDADFELAPTVVEECVHLVNQGADAVVVHNTPDATMGRLAMLRKFEVDMYKFDLRFSSARFMRRAVFQAIGGFDPTITAGEDYDLQNRLGRAGYRTEFAEAEAVHLGEPTRLVEALTKYYRYGKDFHAFRSANPVEARTQLSPFRSTYVRNWRKFVRHPGTAVGFLLYHSAKFLAGGAGLVAGSRVSRSHWNR